MRASGVKRFFSHGNLKFYTVLLILTAGVSKIMTAALPALSSQAAVS